MTRPLITGSTPRKEPSFPLPRGTRQESGSRSGRFSDLRSSYAIAYPSCVLARSSSRDRRVCKPAGPRKRASYPLHSHWRNRVSDVVICHTNCPGYSHIPLTSCDQALDRCSAGVSANDAPETWHNLPWGNKTWHGALRSAPPGIIDQLPAAAACACELMP